MYSWTNPFRNQYRPASNTQTSKIWLVFWQTTGSRLFSLSLSDMALCWPNVSCAHSRSKWSIVKTKMCCKSTHTTYSKTLYIRVRTWLSTCNSYPHMPVVSTWRREVYWKYRILLPMRSNTYGQRINIGIQGWRMSLWTMLGINMIRNKVIEVFDM